MKKQNFPVRKTEVVDGKTLIMDEKTGKPMVYEADTTLLGKTYKKGENIVIVNPLGDPAIDELDSQQTRSNVNVSTQYLKELEKLQAPLADIQRWLKERTAIEVTLHNFSGDFKDIAEAFDIKTDEKGNPVDKNDNPFSAIEITNLNKQVAKYTTGRDAAFGDLQKNFTPTRHDIAQTNAMKR